MTSTMKGQLLVKLPVLRIVAYKIKPINKKVFTNKDLYAIYINNLNATIRKT